jgi:hypothetical protein
LQYSFYGINKLKNIQGVLPLNNISETDSINSSQKKKGV